MDSEKLSIVLDPKSNKKIINRRYKIIKKIGEGQYGKVLLGEDIQTRKSTSTLASPAYVAIKTINRVDKSRFLLGKSYMNLAMKINREIKIMKECNHPNVVKLKQVINDLKFDKILLILEYCKFGEIDWKNYNHYYEKYNHHKSRSSLVLNKVLRDVLNGLEYLHEYKHIIHRDLKPSNLLIDHDNTIKISDFGVSLIMENNANDDKELSKIMGTPAFYAPELCQFVNNRYSMITNENHEGNKIKIDYMIDIWSLGVTLYCMMFNNLPFTGNNEFEMCKNIVKLELKFPMIKHTSKVTEDDINELKEFKDLIKKILVKDPKDRISLQDIKQHKFTTFDLNDKEKRKFLNFNKAIFRAEDCKKDIVNQVEEPTISSRIKKFFSSNSNNNNSSNSGNGNGSGKSSKSMLTSSSLASKTTHQPSNLKYSNLSLKDLEHVDELLDSYLDDSDSSSSMGSIEVEEIDTKNILSDLDDELHFKHRPKPLDLNQSNLVLSPPASLSSPPPLAPTPANTVVPGSSQPLSDPSTPTNNTVMVIGESSPGYNSSNTGNIFSPSRRFFEKQKNSKTAIQDNPTISSLSSSLWNDKSKNHANGSLGMFEPPLVFRDTMASQQQQQPQQQQISLDGKSSGSGDITASGVGISSRRDSNSSQFGYGLSRITSSSSSLNLNAYLTDDSDHSIHSNVSNFSTRYNLKNKGNNQPHNAAEEEEGDDDDGECEGDSTIIAKDYATYHTMSDYLDDLD